MNSSVNLYINHVVTVTRWLTFCVLLYFAIRHEFVFGVLNPSAAFVFDERTWLQCVFWAFFSLEF